MMVWPRLPVPMTPILMGRPSSVAASSPVTLLVARMAKAAVASPALRMKLRREMFPVSVIFFSLLWFYGFILFIASV
jgi:hypothetical protein